MPDYTTMKLPAERHAQLKQMAANMGGVNVSEVLAKLIEFAQGKGLIDHDIPGVTITSLPDCLAIEFEEGDIFSFSFEEAGRLAFAIRAYLSGERGAKAEEENFSLKGKGQGIAISIPANRQPPKVFDRGLAAEFARLIERMPGVTTEKERAARQRQPSRSISCECISVAGSDADTLKKRRELAIATQEAIAAENEATRVARNARRNREKRDPVEYEKQKVKQKEEYEARIAAEEGRAVRPYVKVPGKTCAEHNENAKARDAARKRASRANADQADKDREADRKWEVRMREKVWTDGQIAQGLAARETNRRYRHLEPVSYQDNPNFGLF